MFDKIVVVDNSTVTPTVEAVPSTDRPRAFMQIFSTKGWGKDDEVKLFNANTHSTLASKYGNPGMATTLAPLYYAYEFLRGGGDVYVRRLVATDSGLAHGVIVAKAQVVSTKMTVIFEVQALQTAANLDTMVADAEGLLNLVVDADGNVVYPIAIVGVNWAGAVGNNYTFRLLPSATLDKQINSKAYQLETKPSSTASSSSLAFSTDQNEVLDGQSIYANDIFEEQSQDVYFKILDTYTQFIDYIKTYIPADELTKPNIFFGTTKTGTAYPDYVIDPTSVDFTASGGIALSGGSDGNFAIGTTNRETNMFERYVNAFDELPTKILENEYKYFIDYVFDFGGDGTVKDAIVGFAQRRKTTKAIIDTTTANKTATAVLNARTTGDITYDSEKVAIVGGLGTYRDPFNNRKLTMPLSFFEAYQVANHVATLNGGARPFAGALYTYKNMLAGSYQPNIYDEDGDDATSLKDNQINFAVEDTSGYTASHQTTALKITSLGLSERNNVHLLHLMIRSCLLEAKAERWNFAEDADIERYGDRISDRLKSEMDGKIGTLDIQTTRAGLYGEDRNRVNVSINVRFKFINKGTTFTFTIN